MSDFTSKVKIAVGKVTGAAKEMAQETTDMKDEGEQNPDHEEQDSFKMAQEQMSDDQQQAKVSEFNMSPVSQESQVCWASQVVRG